jgi:hypothetical protein
MPRRAARFLLAGGLVVGAWFALVAVATVVAEPTRRVVVFASAADAVRALARGDALILGGGNGFTIMHGRKPGFVKELYAGGAWLVLPASAGGCGWGSPVRTADAR